MAEFIPFSGLRYSDAVVEDLSTVVAPPYDVINQTDVDVLHGRSEFNVTHLTRPSGDQPYVGAYNTFQDWKRRGVLKSEEVPSFYIYRQRFSDPDTGKPYPERVGVIGLLKVEDYSTGKVLPHENTLSAARADRLSLLRQTNANFESIYGLFADPEGVILSAINTDRDSHQVLGSVADAIGSSHTLEALTDSEVTAVITEYLKTVPIFIADGHHRYETSLGYSHERPDLPGAQYILITLTALEDEGLLVLPTHRLLKNFGPGEIDILPARLIEKGFDVRPIDDPSTTIRPQEFILVLPEREYLVTLPEDTDIASVVPGDQSDAWKSLDVSILHTLIIGDILQVPLDKLSTTDRISYTRDADEAREKVASDSAQAAVIMGRPTVAQMKAVSEAGDKMPQKSTFFYPKLLSGLVLYDLQA